MSTAQFILDEIFGGNGSTFECPDRELVADIMDDPEGVLTLEDVCAGHDAAVHAERSAIGGVAYTRYTFPDGSMIVSDGWTWGIGLSEHCYCYGPDDYPDHHDDCRVDTTVGLSLDAAHDLRMAGMCNCDACCGAFAAAFGASARALGEERGYSVVIVRCTYGSPEDQACDRGDDILDLWQRCHDATPWGRDDAACREED